jgi:hypothetical protein
LFFVFQYINMAAATSVADAPEWLVREVMRALCADEKVSNVVLPS